MKRKNIETLLAWLDALRRGDREAIADALAADIVWQGVGDDLVCHGRAEVADVFEAAMSEAFDVEALELIGAERHAILHARLPGTVEVAGVLFDEGVYNVFAIADGAITRIDDHTPGAPQHSPQQVCRRAETPLGRTHRWRSRRSPARLEMWVRRPRWAPASRSSSSATASS